MAPEVTAEVIAPDLVWDITPGFPYAGVCNGWADVAAQNFFGRLAPEFAEFSAHAEEFFDAEGGHVFVYGHYHPIGKSGQEADARFIHKWTIRDGKLSHLQQAADSGVVNQIKNS